MDEKLAHRHLLEQYLLTLDLFHRNGEQYSRKYQLTQRSMEDVESSKTERGPTSCASAAAKALRKVSK